MGSPQEPVLYFDTNVSAPAGDVDGDRVPDIVFAGHGAIHILLGPLSSPPGHSPLRTRLGVSVFRIEAPECGSTSQVSVSSAGDLNGDGLADVVVLCASEGDQAHTFVLFGRLRSTQWPHSTHEVGKETASLLLQGPIQQDIEPEKANEQPMEQDKNTEQQDGDTEQQDDAEAEQQDKQQDEQEENCQINWDIPASDRSGSVYWACVEDEWTLVVLLNLIIPVNTSMKKQLNCLVLNPAFSVAGVQKKNMCFYINYILRNSEDAINFPLLQQYRQATTPAAHQDYDNAVVQASIIAISTLTRNRVILTTEEAVQARTDCLEVMYFTTLFWDPTENTQPTEAWDVNDIDTMSLQDAHTALHQAVSNAQQDQIIKGLEAARAKLKEKITTYKKEQVRVTNELHEQHVLIAMLKSQNEGLKEQLELLKSEHANWREYESLKGTSTTPSKHKLQANCTVLFHTPTRSALVVDCGGDVTTVVSELKTLGAAAPGPLTAYFTHGHFDHIGGVNDLVDVFGGPGGPAVVMHGADEEPLWKRLERQYKMLRCPRPAGFRPPYDLTRRVVDGDEVRVGDVVGKVLHTPGHTQGSTCLYFEAQKLLVAGDTLFRGAFGRTDLPGGDEAALSRSLKRLLALPEDVTVITGHGPSTTIGYERKNNMAVHMRLV
eukprot:m51a1_g7566 hypothetical protein (661) ;mRNA; f:148535-164686